MNPANDLDPAVLEAAFLSTLPATTAVYVALAVATLVLHVVFMNYALAGTIFVAGAAVMGRYSGPTAVGAKSSLAMVVRDWLPSAVSGAITAGIAPLLFIQMVYQKAFYTANLLLFNRWMAILPVLIAAIYLMYLVKSKSVATGRAAKAACGIGAAGLVVYVALAFAENHLVSLASAAWPDMYVSSASMLGSRVLWLRVGMWTAGAFPLFAAIAAWQLLRGAGGAGPDDRARAARTLAVLASVGGAVALACLVGYARESGAFMACARSAAGRPYAVLAAVGAVAAGAAWAWILVRGQLHGRAVAVAIMGSTLVTIGMTVIREVQRLAQTSGTPAAPRDPALGDGLVVFAVFAVAGIVTIAWIVRTVARSLPADSALPRSVGAHGRTVRDALDARDPRA
jgi:hypothetical protein